MVRRFLYLFGCRPKRDAWKEWTYQSEDNVFTHIENTWFYRAHPQQQEQE